MKKQLLSIITFCSILGGVYHAKAQVGAALNFDGVDDVINAGNSMNTVLNSQNTITVEAWINPTSTAGSYKTIIGNYSAPSNQMQFDMRLQGNTVVFFVNCGAGFQFAQTPANSITPNTWQHIAGVWDGKNIFIYINGVLSDAACCATGSSFATTTNSVVIGGNTVPEMFNGSMDEIRVWTRALCQGEIQNNMNGELTLPQTGLLAYYQFNEGVASGSNSTITTLTDGTGNGYDGTLTNFALTGATSNWITPGGVTSGVNAPLFVSPSISVSGPSIIGAGSSATYTASGNVATYAWSANAGSATTATVTVSPTVTTTYSVIGTNSLGCTSNTAVQTLTVSPAGAALNFDGTANNQINMGTSMNAALGTNSVITVEAWVNPATVTSTNLSEIIGNYQSPSGTQAQFLLRQQQSTYAFVIDAGSGFKQVTSPVGTATANVWQHVAGVWDGNNLMIYVNGVLQATTSGVTGPHLNNTVTNSVVMGFENAGSGEGFAGNMDEVRIWSNARTQCQINTSMNCELANTDRAGLFAYYKFNEGIANNNNPTVTTLVDSSGNGYNGILNAGFALTGTTSNWITPGGVTTGVSCGPVVNPTVTVNSTTVCAGTTTTLTANGATTYSWSTSATTASIAPSPTATTSYTVTGANANYCMASAVSTVSVNTLPTITVNSGAVCAGSSFTMSPSGANTYTYSSGNAVVTPTANATYTVTGTNTVTTCSNMAVSSVTVNALPTITVNSGAVCAGSSFTMSPSGANTYTYSSGNAVVTPTANASYTVTGTNTVTTCSNMAVSSVTVNALPTITVNSGAVCTGSSFTMSPSGANTYTYSSGNAVVTPTANATYTVTGTNTVTTCTNKAVSSVTVNALPTITVNSGAVCAGSSFTMSPSGANTYTYSSGNAVVTPTANASYTVTGTNSVTTCSNKAVSSVTVNALPNKTTTLNGAVITATQTGATYKWINCANNTVIAGATAQSYTATANGNYKVVVNNGTCSDTSTCVSITTIGIAQYNTTNNLQVYPNPFSNELTIVSTAKTNALLFDMLGNKINEFVLQSTTQTISLSELAPGMYYLQVDNSKIKIIKQ